jgi:hypothetical protein
MLFFVTADGFQNGCQEIGSKYNMNWIVGLEVFQMTDQIPT